jgi:hypothetical protein
MPGYDEWEQEVVVEEGGVVDRRKGKRISESGLQDTP